MDTEEEEALKLSSNSSPSLAVEGDDVSVNVTAKTAVVESGDEARQNAESECEPEPAAELSESRSVQEVTNEEVALPPVVGEGRGGDLCVVETAVGGGNGVEEIGEVEVEREVAGAAGETEEEDRGEEGDVAEEREEKGDDAAVVEEGIEEKLEEEVEGEEENADVAKEIEEKADDVEEEMTEVGEETKEMKDEMEEAAADVADTMELPEEVTRVAGAAGEAELEKEAEEEMREMEVEETEGGEVAEEVEEAEGEIGDEMEKVDVAEAEAVDEGEMEMGEETEKADVVEEMEVEEVSRTAGGKRKRGGKNSKSPGRAPSRKKMEEDVCFICFDGGELVLCDRRGCPKAYHPSCVNRDDAFFRAKGRWNCAKLAGVDLCEGTGSIIFKFAHHNVQVLQAHQVGLLCIM